MLALPLALKIDLSPKFKFTDPMNDAAQKDDRIDPLTAISQIMADMSDTGTPAPAAAAEAEAEDGPAPMLDLTRRVNPDGTVTDLAKAGTAGEGPNSEQRVQSAFSALRAAVAEKGIEAPAGVDLAAQNEIAPLIKAWLDEHLPLIVERVVREEVERLARRG